MRILMRTIFFRLVLLFPTPRCSKSMKPMPVQKTISRGTFIPVVIETVNDNGDQNRVGLESSLLHDANRQTRHDTQSSTFSPFPTDRNLWQPKSISLPSITVCYTLLQNDSPERMTFSSTVLQELSRGQSILTWQILRSDEYLTSNLFAMISRQ